MSATRRFMCTINDCGNTEFDIIVEPNLPESQAPDASLWLEQVEDCPVCGCTLIVVG